MAIRVSCPNPGCGAVASVEEQSLGKRGRCKKCGHVFALARPDGEAASTVPGDASAWKKGASKASPPTNLPEQFGRYRILRQLGQGGMGAVYLALDTKLQREVALKVPYFNSSDGPQVVQRFEREGRAAATLDHPNLCPVFDVGEIDGIHYLTMPYIQGKSLSEALGRDRSLTEGQAASIAWKLAQALQEAHDKGIIHRDLKPSNIMVNRRRELIVMDFGLARVVDTDGQKPITRSGHVLGTALYMAPEQAEGDPSEIGPRVDVYSLGVILYELLTGRYPFEGSWALVIGLKNVKDPDPPSKHRAGLNPTLDAICHKAIAKDPKDRYATMSELASELGSFLRSVTNPVLTPSGTVHPDRNFQGLTSQIFGGMATPTRATSSVPPVAPEPSVVKPSGRSRWLWPVGATSSLVAVALVAWLAGGFKISPPAVTTAPAKPPVAKKSRPSLLVAPFDAPAVLKAKQEWADFLKQPVEMTNSIGMKTVLIPPGEFLMGSSAEQIDQESIIELEWRNAAMITEQPQHRVRISEPFSLGKHEVTRGQFAEFVKATRYQTEGEKAKADETWDHTGFSQEDDHPVVQVTWNDATAFCEWLSRKEGRKYRLPTEAEWEYACRAGTTTLYHSGDDLKGLVGVGNVKDLSHHSPGARSKPEFAADPITPDFRDGFPLTAPVGSFRPNAFGLFDMHGNVSELCHDWYGEDYYQNSDKNDPQGPPEGTERARRGGGFASGWFGGHNWSALRVVAPASFRGNETGFRVAIALPDVPQ